MESFIDHFYVCEDLSKLGPLDIQRFATLPEAVAAYQALPGGKVKALGAQNTLPRPGSLDFVQHLNGKDWLLSDCLRLPAWRNAEVQKAWSELQHLLPGVQQRTQALRALMAGLRRKIEPNPAKPQYILTEIGVGYRLVDE